MKTWRVPFPKFGDGIGLHRVDAISRDLGLDLSAFSANAAVITGSNGKGSTSAMLASMLRQTEKPVGLFTSPHLFALNERFNIGGADISDDELEAHWRKVEDAANAYVAKFNEQVGGFEFLFLIAASWFAARDCAFTVWEAGIGGRYDPTRLIRAHRTALVSLDLEHTALLGDTLEHIAYDKLDAAPTGATTYVGAVDDDLRRRIECYCRLRGVEARFVSLDSRIAPPLAGPHQVNNAALAAALARDMAALSEHAVARGLSATRWPGRLEIIDTAPLTVLDVGHTPAAIRLALEGFEAMRGERDAVLVCGASVDKPGADMIGALAPAFATIICAAARHKGAPVAEIANAAKAANLEAEITVAEDVADARRIARAKAQPGGAIYVAGGLFLAAEFKAAHLGLDPAVLAFF